ncbi:ABC transporter substrate-binding protein [Anaerotalea alkaliphila]|uniref:ABC transporter substrate-binding protein n=1 Tax=Anaerotalea alkaliphila TaxID=2662126 RepID=A0A7X5KN32_9FIRM|nr:ABC transporter substrate-binding protein [Anaerotalea alkaliphila]NDL68449.1 ABC transporter substrate-binding protein [Anaerotalea alkaliphila]
MIDRKKGKWVAAFAGLVTTLLLGGCGLGENVPADNPAVQGTASAKPLVLGYPIAGVDFIGGVAGLARELGYLDEELEKAGYAISYQGFSGAGPAVNEALAGGEIDFAVYADFPGIVLQSQGVETRLLTVTNEVMHAGIVVGPDSPIGGIADLKGKKIAFPKGTYVQKYLLQSLEAYGLGQKDVELVNMTTDAESALFTGAIDAVAHVDGFVARIAYGEAGGRIIHTTRENEDWTGSIILLARREYAEENPEAETAFLEALARAKAYAKENPEEVYALFGEKEKLSPEAVRHLHNLDDSRFDYYPLELNAKGLAKLEANMAFLLEEGLIRNDFDVAAWNR